MFDLTDDILFVLLIFQYLSATPLRYIYTYDILKIRTFGKKTKKQKNKTKGSLLNIYICYIMLQFFLL